MTAIHRHELELNELRWWGNWANLRWVGEDAYLMTSEVTPEVFFNRGGLTTCRATDLLIDRLESGLRDLGRTPAIMAYGSCSNAIGRIGLAGYQKADVMSVMSSTGDIESPQGLDVRVGIASSPTSWSMAYLSAFYGELELLPVTRKVVSRVQRMRSTTLLKATIEGEVAGVLALFRTDRLMGVYCVGTIPEFRRKGVAGALLAQAGRTASSEKRTLFLQTLESDGAMHLYANRGFRTLYEKVLMEKKGY